MGSLFRVSFTTGINKSHQQPYYFTLFKIQNLGTEHLIGLAQVTPISGKLRGGGGIWIDRLMRNTIDGKAVLLQWKNQMLLVEAMRINVQQAEYLSQAKSQKIRKRLGTLGEIYDFSIKWPRVQT